MPDNKKHIQFPKLNLVPQDPFYETTIGKSMVWALKVGRYIVVFTEIAVIMSFASRFKIDRDLTDLNASIAQKNAIVQSYSGVESQIRLIQKKSDIITKLMQDNKPLDQLDTLFSIVPPDVRLNRITYTPTSIQINGQAKSNTTLAVLIQILQQQASFKGITVDQIASGDAQDPSIVFIIHIAIGDQNS